MVQVIYKRKNKDNKDRRRSNIRRKDYHQIRLETKKKGKVKIYSKQKRAGIISRLQTLRVRYSYKDSTFELERLLFQEQRRREIIKIKKYLSERDVRLDYRYDFKKLKEVYLKEQIKEIKNILMEMNVAIPDNYDLNKLNNLLNEARDKELLLDEVKRRKIQPSVGIVAPTYFDDK